MNGSKKAVVLLSGGMDSSVALYHAVKFHKVLAVVTFMYNQRGEQYEVEAAIDLVSAAGIDMDLLTVTRIPMVALSALTSELASLDPQAQDAHGQPSTFVPGRNFIFIAHATAIAYECGAEIIVGGWNSVDVNYPDCKVPFLSLAGMAASLALGRRIDKLQVYAPVVHLSKKQIVDMGELLEVPWELTRSCYASEAEPCLECDSCRKRLNAFVQAGVRDPLITDGEHWQQIFNTLGGYGR